MKYRESGMPSEQMWDTFFNPIKILNNMDTKKHQEDHLWKLDQNLK